MIGFLSDKMSSRSRGAVRATMCGGADLYVRSRILHRHLRGWPADFPETEPERTRLIVRRLASALRAERALGRAGHWTYDLNRHIALRQAYLAEAAALRQALLEARLLAAAERKRAPE